MTAKQETIPAKQRAWTWRGNGSPLGLSLARIAVPKPVAGEILVRNEIIGLNPVDWKVLRGLTAMFRASTAPASLSRLATKASGSGLDGGSPITKACTAKAVTRNTPPSLLAP